MDTQRWSHTGNGATSSIDSEELFLPPSRESSEGAWNNGTPSRSTECLNYTHGVVRRRSKSNEGTLAPIGTLFVSLQHPRLLPLLWFQSLSLPSSPPIPVVSGMKLPSWSLGTVDVVPVTHLWASIGGGRSVWRTLRLGNIHEPLSTGDVPACIEYEYPCPE